MASFLVEVTLSFLNFILFGLGQLLLATVRWGFWVLFHFMCGILGLEDRPTSALSWLVLLFALLLYCDRNYCHLYSKLSRPLMLLNCRLYRHVWREATLQYHVILQNQINEHREIEPLNRQLEAENRENENEENILVEADRHRVDADNRRNIERENGTDDQRASLENRRNVERERQDTRMHLENRRNSTQEQHRYFLRQRHYNVPREQHHEQNALLVRPMQNVAF